MTVRSLLLTLLALFSTATFATNGYFSHGYGIQSRGMAGAGVALPQSTLAMATNPAGLATLGNRIDVTAALFSPDRSYEASGAPSAPPAAALAPGKITSDRDFFVIPEAGISKRLSDRWSIGVAMFGNGGMNTSYSTPTYGAGDTGVDLMQLFVTPTTAYTFSNGASLGASVVLAYQRFQVKGLSNFAGLSTSPTNLTDNGHDDAFGLGFNVGGLLPISDTVTLGAHYRSRTYMNEFDDYSGLFAEQGDFDVPATASIGAAWKVTPAVTLALDIQKIWYSHVAAIGNKMMPAMGQCMGAVVASCLGGNDGIGFGWDDMTVVKFGAQWDAGNDWTFRAGYSHGNQPIGESEVFFNVLAPGVMEDHFTVGFTKALAGGKQAIHFGAMYSPTETVKGRISATQEVELEMDEYQVELGWSTKF